MAAGLQVFGPDGVIVLDVTRSYSQHQGQFTVSSGSGSTSIPPLPSGKKRFYFISPIGDPQIWKGKMPGVTISGNTITWQYLHSFWFGQFSLPCTIHYGYY